MFGRNNSGRHHSYNSRALGQGTDPQKYKHAQWETGDKTRLRTANIGNPEVIVKLIAGLEQRCTDLIRLETPPSKKVTTQTMNRINKIRSNLRAFTGGWASGFESELSRVENLLREKGYL